jgi:hypothetical protein
MTQVLLFVLVKSLKYVSHKRLLVSLLAYIKNEIARFLFKYWCLDCFKSLYQQSANWIRNYKSAVTINNFLASIWIEKEFFTARSTTLGRILGNF